MRSRISVIGGGSWGTALAHHLGRKGLKILLWFRDPEKAQVVKSEGRNVYYHPEFKLSENVEPTGDLELCFSEKIIIVAVPTQHLRGVLYKAKPFFNSKSLILSASKGIEKNTLLLPSSIIKEVLGEVPVAALTGPSFSKEVMKGLFTSVVVASRKEEVSRTFQDLLHSENFRVYVNMDIIGCQVGAAVKNVIAIASGMSDGMGLGLNARAALITRGIAEITRLGMAMGANPMTFQGLSGVGDLLLTATGDLSRNRKLGVLLGKGISLKEALDRLTGIPEGMDTAYSVMELSKKLSVRMPISTEVYKVLFEGKSLEAALKDLIGRRPDHEY